MGIGPFSTESKSRTSTVDTDLVGTDQAIVFNVAGGKKSHPTILAPGATSAGRDLIFSSDPVVLSAALQSIAAQSKTFADALREESGESTSTLQQVFAAALEKLGMLAQGAQSDGDTDRNKVVLYVVLGLLAVVGAIFIFGGKK